VTRAVGYATCTAESSPAIVATWPTAFGRLDRLTVDHSRRRARFAARRFAHLQQQFKIDPLEQALVPPIVKIALHRGERRKVLRQQAPLAAGLCDIQDRVDNGAQVGFPRTAQTLDRRRQMLEVAEANLEASLCLCEGRAGHAEIARPSSSTRTIGVPRFAMRRRAPPAAPSSIGRGTEGSNPSCSPRRVCLRSEPRGCRRKAPQCSERTAYLDWVRREPRRSCIL